MIRDEQSILRLMQTHLDHIEDILSDKSVTEIKISPTGSVFYQKKGIKHRHSKVYQEKEIRNLLQLIARKGTAGDAKANDKSSLVNGNLNGIRLTGGVQLHKNESSFLVFRKHQDPASRPSIEQLVEWNMLTTEQAEILTYLFISQKKNLFVVGGTDSGKTTLANALVQKFNKEWTVVIIEDSEELCCLCDEVYHLIEQPTNGLTAREFVKLSKRLSPDRLILGETRGAETFDLIVALQSGHDGSISTAHASSGLKGLKALEIMFQMSIPVGANIPMDSLKNYIVGAVHVVVYISRIKVRIPDSHDEKIVRSLSEILILNGVNQHGEYQYENVSNQSLDYVKSVVGKM